MPYPNEHEAPFKERYPSIRIAWEGLLIGLALATAISSVVALAMYGSNAPWGALLNTWGRLWILIAPAASGTVAAALLIHYHNRVVRPQLGEAAPQEELSAAGPEWPESEQEASPQYDSARAELIAAAAVTMATWKYRDGVEPSRRALERVSMAQPVWNTGHDILAAMKLVDGTKWADVDWPAAESLLAKIRPDGDRIWVVPHGSQGHEMRVVHLGPLRNNRYTTQEEA